MNTLDTTIGYLVESRREWRTLPDTEREELCMAYCIEYGVRLGDVLQPHDHPTAYKLAAKSAWSGAEDQRDTAANRLHQMIRDRALEFAEVPVRRLYLEAWEAEERARKVAER